MNYECLVSSFTLPYKRIAGYYFSLSKQFMHSFITVLLRTLTVSSVLLLGACSKKDDPTITTPTTTYATTWTADGKNYTATTSNGAVNGNNLIIGATYTVSSNEMYSITLGVPAATGTYTIGSSNSTTTAGYGTTIAGALTGYIAASGVGSGTITVTTLSATEIIGTFSFTAMATNASATMKPITNGKFSIKR